MRLDIKHHNDFVIVQFKTICNLNHTNTEEFRERTLGSLEPGKTLIIDFDNLEFIDSAGLTLLIYMRKKLLAQDGQLKLANVGERIQKLLQITRLHRVLEIFNSVEEAAKTLNTSPKTSKEEHPFALRIQVKHTDHYSLVKIKQPDALISANCRQFKAKILQYLKKKDVVIINFDNIRNIDSTGISSLIELRKICEGQSKKIIFVYENTVLSRLFKLYSIEEFFPHFANYGEAIASLNPPLDKSKQDSNPKSNLATLDLSDESFEDIAFLEGIKK